MSDAQTSDRVSAIAARYTNVSVGRLIYLLSKDESAEQTAADIRSLAASALRQDEVSGLRKIARKIKEKLHA